MRNSKLGLRALGLAVLGVLSLTAFFAVGAQAETLPGLSTAGQFQINLGAALVATLEGTQEGAGRFLIPGRNWTTECATGTITNGKIDSSTDALLTILFGKCVAWNFSQTVKLPCSVLTPGETEGSLLLTALVLPVLHGGQNFMLLEAQGLNFAEAETHGATCPLPLIHPVKGSLVAQVDNNDTVSPLLLFSPPVQLLSGDKFTWGGFPVYLDASFSIQLGGDHLGATLGVV